MQSNLFKEKKRRNFYLKNEEKKIINSGFYFIQKNSYFNLIKSLFAKKRRNFYLKNEEKKAKCVKFLARFPGSYLV